MKKIIAVTAMLLCLGLLAGCGAAEPEVATAAATQVPTTEPTIEPTMEPTEPPTLFKELGLELWEKFETSSAIYSWADGKEFIHTEGHLQNAKGNMRAEMEIDGVEQRIRRLVDVDVDITIHENTHLDHESEEHMEAFRAGYEKKTGADLTEEEWAAICENYKMLHFEVKETWDMEPHFEGLKTAKKYRYYYNLRGSGVDVIDSNSGKYVGATQENDYLRDVGFLDMEGDENPVMLMANFESDFIKGEIDVPLETIIEQYLLVMAPRDCDALAFMWGEAARKYTEEEWAEETTTEGPWATGNIREELDSDEYNYYCFSTISPETE